MKSRAKIPGNLMAASRASRVLLVLVLLLGTAFAQNGGDLRFCIRAEPKTLNPLMAYDEATETIRYLSGGVLVRVNRQTQQLEPELAAEWKVSKDGRNITFKLRDNIYFSDGTPFTAADVAYTMQQLMNPDLHSPTGDAFRSSAGPVQTQVLAPNRVSINFPAPVAGLDRLFDQVAILSSRSPKKEMASLGPFYIADYKPGSYVLLNRNGNYWKKDSAGRQLPYLNSVKLDIQPNRDIEVLRFKRGELSLINSLDSEYYDRLAQTSPALVRDAGPSLDYEQLWFNQVGSAPIAPYKRDWFRSANFRRAISDAINRDDLARVVYLGHARAAVGPVSPANKLWFNAKVQPPTYNPQAALRRLMQDGFRMDGATLRDREGHPVEFSIATNSGHKMRERMAAMVQQDLAKIGIKVNVVTFDFPSLIERITEKFNYEAALLGVSNVEPDPISQMNVWLSSGEMHMWNPGQKSPEASWEAEIDRLMREQASSTDGKKRKAAFDRVQEIAYEQAPMIYLVYKNALSAIATNVNGAVPVVLRPQTYWNIERLSLRVESARK